MPDRPPKTILAFGEVLWDLLPGERILGGAPFNFAYRANSLGDVGIIASRLGSDALGDEALARIERLGMDARHIQRDGERPTGTVRVSFDDDHNPHYVITPDVAYDFTEASEGLLRTAEAAACLCFGTLAQRRKPARHALAAVVEAAGRAVKLLDINLRTDCHTPETVRGSLDRADILKLNEDEARRLPGLLGMPAGAPDATAAMLVERFDLACCVVTLAERGALAVDSSGLCVYSPGYRVRLADSLGAGDAFGAGFIHKRLAGAPLDECCDFGNALGAIVAAQPGATGPSNLDDITRFLDSGPERIGDPALADRYLGRGSKTP
jgi:fructokinase